MFRWLYRFVQTWCSDIFDRLSDHSRHTKQLVLLITDMIFVPAAMWLALALRLGQSDIQFTEKEIIACAITIVISAFTFLRLGLYRAVIRFMGHQAVVAIAKGVTVSALVLTLAMVLTQSWMPRSLPFLYWLIAFVLIGGSRLIIRAYYQGRMNKDCDKVIIYGAGTSGRQLLSVLIHSDAVQPVLFIDDDRSLQKTVINGLPVYASEALPELIARYNVTEILLAIPSVGRQRRREIVNKLVGLPVHVRTTPSFAALVQGRALIGEIEEIDIEDLLGRDPISPQPELLKKCITGHTVMVTGAGGSIGAELCRQIVMVRPTRLLLLDVSEYSLYQIEQELRESTLADDNPIDIIPLLGSVRDKGLLKRIFSEFKVDTVYHAAAYKHVPLVEFNVSEGILNNVFGTLYAAEAALEAKVKNFVLVSTDKAVRPTNIMGASKRLAELILQSLAKRQSNTEENTCFSMVRFGNVLGSSGSVVPLFRRQIEAGGPVTVTHTEIIRYFMTIPEAAQLVLQASAMSQGGDVFVLNMGDPIRIMDLAYRMIRLMGYDVKDAEHPHGQIEVKITGLRPGEKLYEELLVGENVTGTGHAMVMRAQENWVDWDDLSVLLDRLMNACLRNDCNEIHQMLFSSCGYVNRSGMSDLLWQATQLAQADKVQARKSNIAPLFPKDK